MKAVAGLLVHELERMAGVVFVQVCVQRCGRMDRASISQRMPATDQSD